MRKNTVKIAIICPNELYRILCITTKGKGVSDILTPLKGDELIRDAEEFLVDGQCESL